MASYSKWLTSKGLKSNAATGAQFRMSQGSDLTDGQYKKLGLSKGSDTMVDGAQTGTPGPDHATISKAVHKYSKNLLKKKQGAVPGLAGVKKPPAKPGWDAIKKPLGDKPDANAPDTLVKDASGNTVSATGDAAAAQAKSSGSEMKDTRFDKPGSPISKRNWKPGPGNQSKAMHDAIAQMNWKTKKAKGKK